jgi:gluconolactonase
MRTRTRVMLAGSLIVAVAASAVTAQALLPGERPTTIAAIPGVIAADAKWEIVWADFETADGIVGTSDGGVMFAQEQTDTIRKLDVKNVETVLLTDTKGAGAVSVDTQGRVFAVQRTCTDSLRLGAKCQEPTRVAQVAPEQRVLADTFDDGKPLGRVNDLIADGKGGAYFTVAGGAYYANGRGAVSVVANQNLQSNGIMLSADGRTLYVTNGADVQAFDVQADGTTTNRRTFGTLNGDKGGDGMAIDAAGRLYVTGEAGVHVLSPEGKHLGVIPTPRRPITVAFAGPDKKTLYVPQMGVVGPDGKPWTAPGLARNVAMTIYRIPMVAEGFKGRPK